MKPTEKQLNRLPKWAQEYIGSLEQRLEIQSSALDRFNDDKFKAMGAGKGKKPDGIYFEDMIPGARPGGTGIGFYTRYIPSTSIYVQHDGVLLRAAMPASNHQYLSLSWGSSTKALGDVAFIPDSYQAARLIPPHKMRK